MSSGQPLSSVATIKKQISGKPSNPQGKSPMNQPLPLHHVIENTNISMSEISSNPEIESQASRLYPRHEQQKFIGLQDKANLRIMQFYQQQLS